MAVYSNSITLASVSDGQSGATLYTWIRYSNGATSNPSVTDTVQGDTKQIGFAYNQESEEASSDYSVYEWSDYIGTDGAPGDDGIGIVNIQEQYYAATTDSPLVNPDSLNWQTSYTWDSTKPYLWTRSEITWTAPNPTNPTHTDPVLASGINSANSMATSANNTANQTSTDLSNYQTSTNQTLQNLQSQIDGQIDVWYQNVDPTTSNYPANQWTTPEEKARHLGDLYYNVSSDSGHSWRWMNSGTSANPVYVWQQIPDSDAAAALVKAQEAEDLAGTKGQIFTSQPTPPYAVGDLWVDGSEVKYCINVRAEGSSYNASDWSTTATDDTAAAAALAAAQGAQSTADTITQNAITKVDVYYAKNASSTSAPSGYDNPAASANWDTNPPTWEDGKYIWSVTVTTKNGVDTVTDPVCITGAKGETGAAAPYIALSGPTNVVTVNTNTSPTTISPSGNIDVIATSANVSSITWSYKVNGVTPSSTPSYISNITNGKRINATTFANTSGVNTLTITASGSNVSDTYTITRIESGKNGTSATQYYTYIKYANSDTPASSDMSDSSTGKKYMGVCVTTATSAPTTYSSYTWTKIVGDDATQYYTYIKYGDSTTPSTMYDIPTGHKYMGICVSSSTSAPTTYSSYTWSKFTGDDGVSITNTAQTITYVTADNGTQPPDSGWSSTPAPQEGKYLWTKTIVTYTYSNTTTSQTTSYSVAYIGTNGDPGRGISSTEIRYAKSSSGTQVPTSTSSWKDSISETGISAGEYLWTRTIITYTSGDPSTTYSVSYWGQDGQQGPQGVHGYNTATINLYKRGSTAPSKPTGSATYTFSTKTITTTNLNGWSLTVPTGSDLLWMIMATATSNTDTDDISSSEWGTQVQVSGENGTDGYNQATLYIYLRSATAPTISGTSTYTFSTHTLTNIPTNWSQTIPATDANKTPCYVSSGVAVSRLDSVSVTWSTPTKLVEDGADGIDAVEVILSNESHTLTANAAGTISSYTGAYTDIQVFEGITDKSTNYSIKVNSKTSGSTTINGITVTVGTRKVTVTAVSSGFTNNVVPIEIYNSSGTKIATKNFTISVSKAGAGINTVTIDYGYSTDGQNASSVTNWGSSIPSVPQGQYLWTRTVTTYTDGSASKTTYSVSRIGVDGDLYRVDTNYQEVYRTYNVNTSTGEEIVNYSPSILTFRVYKEDTLQTCNTNYKYDVSILYDKDGYSTDINTDYIYNFLTGLVIPSGSSFPFTLSNNNQIINFNIQDFMALTSNNSNDKTRIEEIQNLVRTANIFFVITILDPSSTVGTTDTYKILTKHIFSVTNSVTSSLASFSTTANSINAAVREAKMNFTTDGLEIVNGSFSIKDKNGQEVLSYRTGAENLYVKGRVEADDGYFYGELKAAKGSFAGDISAATGTFTGDINVGGNSVFGGRLDAASGTFTGELIAAEGSFSGAITAQEGEIGGFKIGETALYANVPSGATTATSHLVLDSATPSIKLGSLSFDGSTSTIQGNSFTITPDTAWFNNIALSGKITASVFEIGKTQAVGGAMIFKPSYKVESFTSNSLTLDVAPTSLTTTQHVLVIDKEGNEISDTSIKSISGKTVNFNNNPFSGEEPNTLIILGTDTDIIIGIDSTPNGSSFLMGEGLTIRTYNKQKPNLFLGNLGNSKNAGIIGNNVSGYGLYADNVVLNGSLTTIVTNASTNNPTYAGVNTLSPVQANKFNNDSSNVVFWAGSAGVTAEQIANAPFQVTERGSLYAAQGKFEGAIITRSEIQGVDIYGARIHGTGNNPGLGVYNTTNGITFYRGDYGNDPVETFSIGSTGLQFNGSYFINVGGTGNIDFTGDEFHGNSFVSTNLVQGVTLVASDANGSNTISSTKITNSTNSYIEFTNSINFNVKNSGVKFQLEEARGVFNTEYLITQKNLQIGNNTGSAMRFMQVTNGYDLYIA